MAKRDPRSDPQPGDLLRWQDWSVEILGRQGDTVHYRAKLRGDKDWRKNTTQSLAEWTRWTPDTKVLRRGLAADECVESDNISARCFGCRKWIEKGAHLSDVGIFCAECCPGKHKAKGVTT